MILFIFFFLLVVEDCGDIGEHNKMTIALEKIKSLASSHPINSSTFDLGMFQNVGFSLQKCTNNKIFLPTTIFLFCL